MVLVISGGTGCVNSTANSSVSGKSEKELAPKSAKMTYGAGSVRLCGAQIRAIYEAAVNGTRTLMASRKVWVLSIKGDTTADTTRPTTMRIAPPIPA